MKTPSSGIAGPWARLTAVSALALILAASLPPTLAVAQDAAATSTAPVLSLDEALRRAALVDPSLAPTQARRQASRAAVRQADVRPNPTLGVGEYQALFKLAAGLKPAVVPLIEVLPPDFDFEQWRPKKEIDDHLGGFAAKLEKKWSDRPALIDGRQLAPATRMADGRHTMTFLFDEARKLGASLTPVINLESDAAYRKAVHDIDAIDMNGAVLRCTLEEALDPDFDDHVDALLKALAIDIAQLDIVLDLGAPAYSPQGPLVGVIRAALNGARMLSARSVVVMAASFPETMTELKLPIQTVSREEWRLYAALVTAQSPQERRPSFGDYAVAAVKFAQGDMRFMRGSPNVRYAVSDGGWLVARSKRKKGETNQAYPGLCGLILSSGQYHGATFSEGSAYIEDCHAGAAKRGNPTVWKWVATNHHITVVLDDLAKLPAP